MAELLEGKGALVSAEPWSSGLAVLAFDLEAGLAASVAQHAATRKHLQTQEESLEQALSELEPGATLDKTTPADGHCLFHALLRGGLARLQDIPCQLTMLGRVHGLSRAARGRCGEHRQGHDSAQIPGGYAQRPLG